MLSVRSSEMKPQDLKPESSRGILFVTTRCAG